ncbi:MAG: lytic transglycosylase domain-containing protein [Rhodocyclaceae bacterium]|nr:lytic transglycosylase domain-containing protein [Rhodocyclaceae bacterium]
MKRALLLAAWTGLLAATPMPVLALSGDERIVAAREAMRTGRADELEALASRRDSHLLQRYVEYWLLSNRLARRDRAPDVVALDGFVRRHEDSVLAERLREAWIRRSADDGDWPAVLARFRDVRAPDRDVECHYLHGRLLLGDRSAVGPALDLWRDSPRVVEACEPVFRRLVTDGQVDREDIWQRLRWALSLGRAGDAKVMAAWLDPASAPDASRIDAALKKPVAFVDRLPVNFSTTRTGRELALAALARVASDDAAQAHFRLQRLFDRFKSNERAFVYGILGWRGAEQHLPDAIKWYRAAGDAPLTEEQHAWRVRAALRATDWKAVRSAIEALPERMRGEPAWIYWHGRSLAAMNDDAGAVYQYARIADGADFYGLLAAEELGRSFEPPPTQPAQRQAARERVRSDQGLQRALALFRLDMRTEGVREWNWALQDQDDDFLIAAAALAAESGVYDRAINTAERVSRQPDMGLRYLAPYRELIEPQARAQGLELSWVYGLMRQESRFVPAARSSAGAQGLMQIMPATGRWVARKIGVRGFNVNWLREPQNNVMIGTHYMRMVMEGLDHHPVLASAGYNAGPGRARRWRDQRPLEGAIYAETIPFDETRRYVKQVMANAVVYGALFESKPQSLKARLGTIRPAQ